MKIIQIYVQIYYNTHEEFIIGSVKHHDAKVDFQGYLRKCVIFGVKYGFHICQWTYVITKHWLKKIIQCTPIED